MEKSIISISENPCKILADKVKEIYPAGIVGIIYDSKKQKDALVRALAENKNTVKCFSLKDLIKEKIPSFVRTIIGVGSRKIIGAIKAQNYQFLCFFASDYVIDYFNTDACFIVYDKKELDKREAVKLALGYTNATSVLISIIDYLSISHLKIGEPTSELMSLRNMFTDITINNIHNDNYISNLIYSFEKASRILSKFNITSIFTNDILSVLCSTNYPSMYFEPTEYCKYEFFINFILLSVFLIFYSKKYNGALIPKDINAIISLCESLDISTSEILSYKNLIRDDYIDRFSLLTEENSSLGSILLSKGEIYKLSFNIRALMGKGFFKDLSLYDFLCYTLIANELRQKDGLINELINAGFIDALMEDTNEKLSKYKAMLV